MLTETKALLSSNVFAHLAEILSTISQQNKYLINFNFDENSVKDRIIGLSETAMLELKKNNYTDSEIQTLKDRINDLRKSGNNNFAQCEKSLSNLEVIINKTLNRNHFSSTTCQPPLSPSGVIFTNSKIIELLVENKLTDPSLCQEIYNVLNAQPDGGFNLLLMATPIFKALNLSDSKEDTVGKEPSLLFGIPISKLFILKTLSYLIDTSQEIDLNILLKLFNSKDLDRSEEIHLEILKNIPINTKNNALMHASKFFSDKDSLWEKFTFILEIALSKNNKLDPIRIAKLFTGIENKHFLSVAKNIPRLDLELRDTILNELEKILKFSNNALTSKTGCNILSTLMCIGLKKEKRELYLTEINNVYQNSMNDVFLKDPIFGDEVALSYYYLSQVDDEAEMKKIMVQVNRLVKEKLVNPISELSDSIALISHLPKEEREKGVDLLIKISKYFALKINFFNSLGSNEITKKDLVFGIMFLSNIEKEIFFNDHLSLQFDQILKFPHCVSKNFFFEYMLVYSSSNPPFSPNYQSILTTSIGKKLENPEKIPNKLLTKLCKFTLKNQNRLGLSGTDPIIQRATQIFEREKLPFEKTKI